MKNDTFGDVLGLLAMAMAALAIMVLSCGVGASAGHNGAIDGVRTCITDCRARVPVPDQVATAYLCSEYCLDKASKKGDK